jgi:thioredoxin-related protein
MRSRSLLLFISLFVIQTSLLAQAQREMEVGFEWSSLEEAQIEAAETGKKILLFGYAEWCTYCLKTRRETFPDSTVLASIDQFYIPVQLDAESEREITYNGNTMPEYELARYLRLSSYPIHYFLDSSGELIGAQPGFIEPFVYGPLLDYVGSDAYKNQSFEEYFEIVDEGDDN